MRTSKLQAINYNLVILFCFSSSVLRCLGFVSRTTARPRVSHPLHQTSYQEQGQQEFEAMFDPTKMEQNPEALPDDIPKGVSTESIVETIKKEQTLYEILAAPPTATRVELKKRYLELAKISHPDAQIGKTNMNDGDSIIPDFGEIAAAWRVLGDSASRKRYDRDLRAKKFSEAAERFTNEKLEQAVPAVAAMMDRLAVPFLRRTTATTWAVGQAVAKGVYTISNKKKQNNSSETWTHTFIDAIQAGKQAGRVIDSIELTEKSSELEERAKIEQARAEQIAEELSLVTEKRLFATLQSGNFALSSDEAKQVMDRLDIEDTVSIVDRAMLRNTIEKEIQSLEEAEVQFSEKLEQYESTDSEWSGLLNEQEGARQELSVQKQQEIEARKALAHAQKMVAEAKAHLVITSNALRGVELKVRKNAHDMDRVTSTLSKRQERVRSMLRKKADMMSGGIQVEYLADEDLASLRKKESQLIGESKQVARMVARLSSRAEKLMIRADALEKWQKNGNNGQTDVGVNGVNGQ